MTGAVTRRLESLPAESRRILAAASVVGNRLLPDVLALVVDDTVGMVLSGLDAPQEAGVIRTGPEEELWFTHDLFRETLYGQLSLTERVDSPRTGGRGPGGPGPPRGPASRPGTWPAISPRR